MNDDETPMSLEAKILWTLVAVALVLFFAALVSKQQNDMQWSHVESPPTTTSSCVVRGCVP